MQRVLTEHLGEGPVGSTTPIPIGAIAVRVVPGTTNVARFAKNEVRVVMDLHMQQQYATHELAFTVDGRPSATTTAGIADDTRLSLGLRTADDAADPRTNVVVFGQDVRWNAFPVTSQPSAPLAVELRRQNRQNPVGVDVRANLNWRGRTPAEVGMALTTTCSHTDPLFASSGQVAITGNELSGATLDLDAGYSGGRGVGGGEVFNVQGSIERAAEHIDARFHQNDLGLSRSADQPTMALRLARLSYGPDDGHLVAGTPRRAVQVSGDLNPVPAHLRLHHDDDRTEIGVHTLPCSGTGAPADALLPRFPAGCTLGPIADSGQIRLDWQDFLSADPAAAPLVQSPTFESPPGGPHAVIEHTDSLGGRYSIIGGYNRAAVAIDGVRQVRYLGLPHAPDEFGRRIEVHQSGATNMAALVAHQDTSTSDVRTTNTGRQVDARALVVLPTDLTADIVTSNGSEPDVVLDTAQPVPFEAAVDVRGPAPDATDISIAAANDGTDGLPTHLHLGYSRSVELGVGADHVVWDANTPTKVRVAGTVSDLEDRNAGLRLRFDAAVTVPEQLDVTIRRIDATPGDLVSATAKACGGVTVGCTNAIDASVDYGPPQKGDGELFASPVELPSHPSDVAPAFDPLDGRRGVRLVKLSDERWGGRFVLADVVEATYAATMVVDRQGTPAQSVCLTSVPSASPFETQLYTVRTDGSVGYVDAKLNRLPSSLYATVRPNLDAPVASDDPTGPISPEVTEGGGDRVERSDAFYLSDTCWSLPPTSTAGDGTQPQGRVHVAGDPTPAAPLLTVDAIVRSGDEAKLRELGPIVRINRLVPDTITEIAQEVSQKAAPAPEKLSDEEQKILDQQLADQQAADQKLADQKLAEQKLGEQKLADEKVVVPADVDPKIAEGKVVEPTKVDPNVADGKVVDPMLVDPKVSEPVKEDPAVKDGRETVGLDPVKGGDSVKDPTRGASGPGIDVRGRMGSNATGGVDAGLDIRIVETFPRWFAVYPVVTTTCEPNDPCQRTEGYEQEDRSHYDVRTRSSLKTLGELSADLWIDHQRILGRVENVPANLTGSLGLVRNVRLPWTDLDVDIRGGDALRNITFEVYDQDNEAYVGPAQDRRPIPTTNVPPYKCEDVPMLCEGDPRPAPGGSPRPFPDPGNRVPNYRVGLANVTDHLEVHGRLHDSEHVDGTSTCAGSRTAPMRMAYAHIDLDLRNQATRLDLTKRTGVDPATGSFEASGQDLRPHHGTDSDPPAQVYPIDQVPDSTTFVVHANAKIDGSIRVRTNNIVVAGHERRDFALGNYLQLDVCDDLDLPFEISMRDIDTLQLAQSGAEVGLDVSHSDSILGGATFRVHEVTANGDIEGAPYAKRNNRFSASWYLGRPTGDFSDIAGPGYKSIRLMPNAPVCDQPHYDGHEYPNETVKSMCYRPGMAPVNTVSVSAALPLFGGHRAFMMDVIASDSFAENLWQRDSYGVNESPVPFTDDSVPGPGNSLYRAIAHKGLLPTTFAVPSIQRNVPMVSTSREQCSSVPIATSNDGTTYQLRVGSLSPQCVVVARHPNGQIRWITRGAMAMPGNGWNGDKNWSLTPRTSGGFVLHYEHWSMGQLKSTISKTWDASGRQIGGTVTENPDWQNTGCTRPPGADDETC
jgi:hypothetical protein